MKKLLGLSFALLALGCMACAEDKCAYDDEKCIEECAGDKCKDITDLEEALKCAEDVLKECVDESTIPSVDAE